MLDHPGAVRCQGPKVPTEALRIPRLARQRGVPLHHLIDVADPAGLDPGGAVGVVVQAAAMRPTSASAIAGLRMFVSVRGKRRVAGRVRLEVRHIV